MRKALEMAEISLICGEIPVGCVFVDSHDNIITAGHNKTNESRNGTKHAELVAVDELIIKKHLDPAILKSCDLFVTCEPCIMCAAALGKLGIARVFYGCSNDRFGGTGSILSIHSQINCKDMFNYEVYDGILKEEAIEIFQRFYTSENKRAPASKRKRKAVSITSDPTAI